MCHHCVTWAMFIYKIHFQLLTDPAGFNLTNWMFFLLRFMPLESVTSGMLQISGSAVFKGEKKFKIKEIGIKQSYVGKSFL